MEGNLREVSLPNADGHNELRLQRGFVKIIKRIEVNGLTEFSETIQEFLLSSTKLGNIELTLVFPTVDNKEASQQQCFCFLPVQRTGLRDIAIRGSFGRMEAHCLETRDSST